jgi:hypothetical protein
MESAYKPLQVAYRWYDFTNPRSPLRFFHSAESAESRELYFDGQKLITKEEKMKYVLALLHGLRPNPIF